MYTPVTEEGAKGEPQYKYTDFIKAGMWMNNCIDVFSVLAMYVLEYTILLIDWTVTD